MPQALAAAIVAALPVTAGSLAATVLTGVVTLASAIGFSKLIGAVFGRGGGKPSDGQVTTRAAVGSRKRYYGIVHTGGQLSFEDSAGGTLARVWTIGQGEETEILEHRIHDKVVTVDGSGTVTDASFRGALHIYTRAGADDQTAIGELTAKFPAWTADHRQRGCPHVAAIGDPVKQKHFSEVYNNRPFEYSQVRKAVKVYDPRLDSTAVIFDDGAGFTVNGTGPQRLNDRSTWAWSDNGPLVVADYFAHEDGYGGGFDNVDWTCIAGEAEVADDDVVTVTEETIKRWRLWGGYEMARDERRQVLTDMLKAIDGFDWQGPDGKFNMRCGRWIEPTVTITDDHIVSMAPRLGPQAQHRVDALKVLYTEAAIGYREQESATIVDPEATDDPNTDPQSVEAFFAPHHNQAARIGKLTLARLSDDRWHIPIQLNVFGLNLLGERFVRLDSAAFGEAGYYMIDGGVQLLLNPGEMRVATQLIQVKPEDWDFDASTEEGTPPIAPEDDGGAVTIDAPTGLTLSAVQIALGETFAVAIEASWDAGREGLAYQARYRPSAGGTWVMMTVDNDARTARSGPVDSEVEYEVQVQAITITWRESDWSAAVTITPVADLVLGAPTSLVAEGAAGEAEVRFSMPTGSALSYARLYGADSDDFGAAVQIGADIVAGAGVLVVRTDTGLSAGDRFYWARAFDADDNGGGLAGPVSTTIT